MWCRSAAGCRGYLPVPQDPADSGSAHVVAELEQLALDALVSPRRVLQGELLNERGDRLVDRWAARVVRVRPLFRHQPAVPTQHRVGSGQTVPLQLPGQLSDQSCEVRAVGPVEARLGVRAAQHSDLMTEDQQLDVLGRGGTGERCEPAEQPAEDQIEQT